VDEKKGQKWKYELSYQTDRLRTAGAELKDSLIGLGAALKSKVGGERSDTPSVNLNRGNSQFLDGPIPTHSRNNSAASSHLGNVPFKERAQDWWERLGERFNWRSNRNPRDSGDPFASAREKQAASNTQNFSRLPDMEEQLQAERRRSSSLSGNGSLGLNFGIASDPFTDPAPKPTTAYSNPFADPTNPFSDPPARPEPSIPKPNTYIADIRRSRGQSIDATTTANNASNTTSMYRPPSTSRYPSTIAPSRDSYRDTVFSSFSANVRKGKGRSDPFDLERPELWKPRIESTDMYPPPLTSARMNASNAKAQGILGMDVGGQPGKRITYNSSKYSSGISGISEWGDPGPDVAPGSLSKDSVLAGGLDIYAQQQGGGGGYGMDANGVSRNTSNASSKGGVGKAMWWVIELCAVVTVRGGGLVNFNMSPWDYSHLITSERERSKASSRAKVGMCSSSQDYKKTRQTNLNGTGKEDKRHDTGIQRNTGLGFGLSTRGLYILAFFLCGSIFFLLFVFSSFREKKNTMVGLETLYVWMDWRPIGKRRDGERQEEVQREERVVEQWEDASMHSLGGQRRFGGGREASIIVVVYTINLT
jgi:hypothetical protein